ncbi:MAG: 2-amino-4-hydroxy-6-hydroxymethyldihydropteridine diphosphokinase [Methylococcaceae bacterium]
MQTSLSPPVIAYIGLGSNLVDPIVQIKSARIAVAAIEGVQELTFSGLYHSLPMGPQDQPDYVNAVMGVVTELSAMDLLRSLQHIENDQGRIRNGEHWGPRTLDLDMLTYGEQEIDEPDLIVPHKGMEERSFVLYPLFEIAPQLHVPNKGSIVDLIAKCPLSGLKRINSSAANE